MENCESLPYAYLLGLYLSDGYINDMPRTAKLRVSLGTEHADVIHRCKAAMASVFPCNKINEAVKGTSKAVDVYVYSKRLRELFPQHGSGKKHDRLIELADWQEECMMQHSKALIAGLFDGDGSEYIQTAKSGQGYRYFVFCNKSKDICDIFKKYCAINSITTVDHTRRDGVRYMYIRKKAEADKFSLLLDATYGSMAELVDARNLKFRVERRAGSSPAAPTT